VFHARPANSYAAFTASSRASLAAVIDETFAQSRPGFDVFVVQHKYEDSFAKQVPTACVATPLLLTLCADGHAYTCLDHRGEAPWRLAPVDAQLAAVRAAWGSQQHRDQLAAIDPTACVKCTLQGYNDLFAYGEQQMQLEFL
jgi:hypothetical protein